MEDVYRTLGGAVDLWDLPNSIDNDGFDATEFWLHHRSDKVEVKHRFVTPAERDAWLTTRFIASPTPGHDQSLLARFVWLVADSETRSVNLSDTSQKVLRKHFCLTLAHGFFKTFITGVTAFPRVAKPTEDRRAYAFCYGPKLAAIWSHARFAGATAAAEGITEGIIYARADPKNNIQQDQKPMLQTFLSMITINPHLARSSTFPVYLFSLLLGQQIDETQSEIRKAIRAVETRTGFHTFQSRKEMPNPAELMSLSATTSGHATKLAAVDRKSQMIDRLLKFIVTMVDEDEKHAADKNIPIPGATTELNQFSLLRHNVDVLKERLAMQSLDTQYTLTRVQIQIEALFNIIAQHDNINNYELARASHRIASYSYRDSSSMKTLAIVTMFFLPGSFISALFSAPFFAWDELNNRDYRHIGVRTTPQFNLYWAITIPITVLTFILYFSWVFYQKYSRSRGDPTLNEKATPTQPPLAANNNMNNVPIRISSEAERHKLSRRRATLLAGYSKEV